MTGNSHLDALREAGSVFPEAELDALRSAAGDEAELRGLVAERARGVPVEHLIGWAAFGEVRVELGPGVFVPRPRTLWLVELAGRHLLAGAAVLDLGCGSGAIGALLAHRVPAVSLTALEADPVAASWARRNLPGGRVVVADSLAPIRRGGDRFTVIVANLPYVPTEQLAFLPHEARDFEPLRALDGGPDGLEPLRSFAPDLVGCLLPRGWFGVEVAAQQADEASQVLQDAGLVAVAARTSRRHRSTVVEGLAP